MARIQLHRATMGRAAEAGAVQSPLLNAFLPALTQLQAALPGSGLPAIDAVNSSLEQLRSILAAKPVPTPTSLLGRAVPPSRQALGTGSGHLRGVRRPRSPEPQAMDDEIPYLDSQGVEAQR